MSGETINDIDFLEGSCNLKRVIFNRFLPCGTGIFDL